MTVLAKTSSKLMLCSFNFHGQFSPFGQVREYSDMPVTQHT
jgi:hypothetical protein